MTVKPPGSVYFNARATVKAWRALTPDANGVRTTPELDGAVTALVESLKQRKRKNGQ